MGQTAADAAESDAAIVRRILHGEVRAYGTLVERYQTRLRSVLSFYSRSAEEVEEFLQEAFVQGYLSLRQYDTATPIYPWLKAIALNALRMEIRRRDRRRGTPGEYLRHLQLSQAESDRDGFITEARSAAFHECFRKLPPSQAELLSAKYREGLPLADLAARVGTTLGALKIRLLRLREALRTCIARRLALDKES